jgi:hypothetical protein
MFCFFGGYQVSQRFGSFEFVVKGMRLSLLEIVVTFGLPGHDLCRLG